MGETRDWLKFFEEAGIPRSASAQYAVTFIDNRISMDMLMDLNKEYLRDMGISKLGDIISILKQAKVVSQKLSADKALSNKIEDEVEQKVIKIKKSVEAPASTKVTLLKKSTPPSKGQAPSPKVESQRVVIRSKSPVSTRLGPPPEQKFSNPSKKNANVFERLGHSEKLNMSNAESVEGSYGKKARIMTGKESQYASKHSTDSKSAFERLSSNRRVSAPDEESNEVKNGVVVRKRIVAQRNPSSSGEKFTHVNRNKNESIATLKRESPYSASKTTSHGVFNKSDESNLEKVPVQKRLGNIRPVPATAMEDVEYRDKPKKVKYVMVQTLKDGSQVRKTLRPDDPLLKTIPISKARVKSSGATSSRSLSESPISKASPRRIISTKKPYEGFSLNRSLPERSSSHYGRGASSSNHKSPSPVPVHRSKRISPPPKDYKHHHYDKSSSFTTRRPYYNGNKRKY